MLYSKWQQKLLDKGLEVTDLKKYIKNFLPNLSKAAKKGYIINMIIPAVFVHNPKLFYAKFKKDWDGIISLCDEGDAHMIHGNILGYVDARIKILKKVMKICDKMEKEISGWDDKTV